MQKIITSLFRKSRETPKLVPKRIVYKAVDGSIHRTKLEAAVANREYYKAKGETDKYKTVYKANDGKVYDTLDLAKDANILKRYKDGMDDSSINRVINYAIPWEGGEDLILTNAGLATGAYVSTNLLDSIAVNALRAGIPLREGLGIGVKESTLGNNTVDFKDRAKLLGSYSKSADYGKPIQHINIDKNPVNEDDLVTWTKQANDDYNPYAATYNYAITLLKKNLIKGNYNFDSMDILRKSIDADDRKAIKARLLPKKSVLLAAFERYKANKKSYNPGQENYEDLVNARADELYKSPEIQHWLRTSKYARE